MPVFRLKFQRRHRYDISAKGYFIVSVTLLDGTTIDQTVTADTCGKDCINFVAQKIGIRDVNYFGLQYQSAKGQRWINLAKPVKRQLDKYALDHSLRFGVMFFVEDPYAIVDDVARELYYLQLRYNLLSGLIPCSLSRAITLAAYGFQVDFSDCSQANLSFDYLLDYRHISNDLMPVNDSDYKNIVEEILKQYQLLEGTDCKLAQCVYIELIQKNTPHFGVAYFPAKTRKGQDVKLGLSQRGVRLFGNADMGEVELRWSDIASFQSAGRTFSIARTGGGGGSSSSSSGGNLQLRLDDPDTAKYVLQYCAQLHAFYISYCARVVTPPQQHQQIPIASSAASAHDPQSPTAAVKATTLSTTTTAAAAAAKTLPDTSLATSVANNNNNSRNSNSSGNSRQLQPTNPVANGNKSNGDYSPWQQQQQQQQKPMHIRLPSYRKASDYAALIRQREQQQQQQQQAVMATADLEPPPKYPVSVAAANAAVAAAAGGAGDFELECPASRTVRNYLHSLESDGLLLDQPPPQPQQQQQIMMESGDYDQPQFLMMQHYQHQQYPFPLATVDAAGDCYYPERQDEAVIGQAQHPHQHHQQHIYDNLPQPDLLLASGVANANKNVACSTPDLHHLLSVLDKGETQLAHRLVRDFQQTTAAAAAAEAAAAAASAASASVSAGHHPSHHHSTPNLHRPSLLPAGFASVAVGAAAAAEASPSSRRDYENLRPSSNRLPAKPPAALALTSSSSFNAGRPQPAEKALHKAVPYCAAASSSRSSASESSESSSSSSTASSVAIAAEVHAAAAAAADGGGGGGTESFCSDEIDEPDANATALTPSSSDEDSDDEEGACFAGDAPQANSSALNVKPSLTVSTANLLWEQSELSISYMPRDERRQQLEDHRSTVDLGAEFDQIQTRCSRAQCLVAKRPHNAVRNRCQDAVPYDHNRFALSGTADNPDGYYNASQVEVAANIGHDAPLFIAAESPRADTRADFWRLAWESGAKIVAQLCAPGETARYYPAATKPGEKVVCDAAYEVQLVNATASPDTDYSIATLAVRELATGRVRTVWLFVYPIWTADLVPASAAQFLMFLDEVDSLRRLLQSEESGSRQTVLLHCPDGSGRSGLAICLMVYKACLQHNQSVSLPTVLCSLRGQRMGLVQSLRQYEFVYEALIRSLDSTRLI